MPTLFPGRQQPQQPLTEQQSCFSSIPGPGSCVAASFADGVLVQGQDGLAAEGPTSLGKVGVWRTRTGPHEIYEDSLYCLCKMAFDTASGFLCIRVSLCLAHGSGFGSKLLPATSIKRRMPSEHPVLPVSPHVYALFCLRSDSCAPSWLSGLDSSSTQRLSPGAPAAFGSHLFQVFNP